MRRRGRQPPTALNGIVAYSQALTAVATAGAEGATAAGNVAKAVNGLLASFNVAAIPANLVAGFKALNAQIAVIRAKRSLHEAVGAADPVVAELATILSAQLKTLATLHEHHGAERAPGPHRANHSPMVDYVEAERRSEAKILRILQRHSRLPGEGGEGRAEELLIAITEPRSVGEGATTSNQERRIGWIS